MRKSFIVLAAVAILSVLATSAMATTFLGKGDVQRATGWNNRQLQDHALTVTQYRETSLAEYTWTCTGQNGNIQEKDNEVTVSISATAVARDGKSQVTGFHLAPTSTVTEGANNLGKCGANATFNNDLAGPTPVEGGGTREVLVGGVWKLIP